MAKQKTRHINIEQKDGTIRCYVNGELEYTYDGNFIVERVKEGYMNGINVANLIAEIMHDCLNCKTATAELHDLNEAGNYHDYTYFSSFDYATKNQ